MIAASNHPRRVMTLGDRGARIAMEIQPMMRRLRKHSIRYWLAGVMGLASALVYPTEAQAATVWTGHLRVSRVISHSDGAITVYLEDLDGNISHPCETAFAGNTALSATQAAAAGSQQNLSLLTAAVLAHRDVTLYVTASAAGAASCTFSRVQLYAE